MLQHFLNFILRISTLIKLLEKYIHRRFMWNVTLKCLLCNALSYIRSHSTANCCDENHREHECIFSGVYCIRWKVAGGTRSKARGGKNEGFHRMHNFSARNCVFPLQWAALFERIIHVHVRYNRETRETTCGERERERRVREREMRANCGTMRCIDTDSNTIVPVPSFPGARYRLC